MELGEGGARNHVANLAEGPVGAQSLTLAGQAQPDAPAVALHGVSQSAVVNHFAANCGEPPDSFEHLAPEEDTTTCGAGGARGRICNLARRIKLQEEVGKGGDKSALGKRAALEENAERREIEVVVLGAGDEAAQHVRSMNNVRIREPVIRGLRLLGSQR